MADLVSLIDAGRRRFQPRPPLDFLLRPADAARICFDEPRFLQAPGVQAVQEDALAASPGTCRLIFLDWRNWLFLWRNLVIGWEWWRLSPGVMFGGAVVELLVAMVLER